MPKALLIYNPVSGRGRALTSLGSLIGYLHSRRISILPVQTPYCEKMLASLLEPNDIQYVFVAGGDGTLNMVLNSLMKYESFPPLGIIPAGTANHLANNLGLCPLNSETGNIEGIKLNESSLIDVGKAGDMHFFTAALGGHVINTWHNVNQKLKGNLGVLAYYLEGIRRGVTEMPKLFRTMEIDVMSEGKTIFQGDAFLFLIFNGRDSGRLNGLAPPNASLTDGLLDCVFFRKYSNHSPADFLNLLFKVITGNHIQDDNVIYLQTADLYIDGPTKVATDMDGEKGPGLPWQVNVLPRRMEILKWQT